MMAVGKKPRDGRFMLRWIIKTSTVRMWLAVDVSSNEHLGSGSRGMFVYLVSQCL
jgi:hypothetical protein